MSDNINVNVDIADLMVVLDKGDNYNINIQEPSTVVINETMFYRVADYATNAGTSSFALTASYVQGVSTSWNTLADKPSGIVSSSTQVNYNLLQNLPSIIPTASLALTALTASYVSGAISDWDSLNNKPQGIVSSSQQALLWTVATASYVLSTGLPSNIISSSTQVDYNLLQNLPTTIATASLALTALTASYVSGAASNWDTLANKPAGIVSSSTQVDYTLLLNIPSNLVSQSSQITLQNTFGNLSASRIDGVVSYSLSSSFASSSISSSFAETSSLAYKVRIFSGSVGDGSAVYTGSFTGSFYGDGSNLTGIPSIISSGSAPNNPDTNELWYDDTTGKTYIYYVSGSDGSWVLQSDPTYDPGLIISAATASIAFSIPSFQPATPQTGSIYFSSGFLYVYDGQKYVSSSLN